MQAIRDFKYVLDTAEDNPLAMYGIGRAYQEMRNYHEAEKWFLQALDTIEFTDTTQEEKTADSQQELLGSISKSFFVVRKGSQYSRYFKNSGINVRRHLEEVCQLAR